MSDDLMIEIGHGAEFGRYPVRVTHAPSPSGSEREETLHLDLEDLRDRRDNLAKTINIFGRAARRSVPVSEQQIREIGRRLFCALFRESVADTYHQSLGMVQTRRRPLRLVLWLTDPELAALPWESLYDPDSNAFLAKRWPVVRYVRSGYTPPPLEVQRPLRILGLVALPEDTVTLNVEAEQENLENALVDLLREGIVEIEWELETTWNHVQDRLLNKEWHVVHFIGHGGYDEENDETYLQFVSEGGGTQRVQANKLVDLLCNTPLPPRLVVLNSCSSGEGSPGDIFSSTAAALAKGGISAVAAMQFTITDEAAIAFSRGFYRAIAEGLSVDQAVHNGRRAIIGLPSNRMEWVTPVLYVLGETRELFKFAQQSSAAMRSTTPPPTQIQNVAGHYEQARDAEDACDWPAAIHKYKELLAIDPYYRDASARKKACEVQQQVANWQVQLRIHAEQGAWREVVETARELWRLDPSASDPDGLTTKARRNLRAASPRHVSVGSWNIHQVSWHPKGTQLSVATDSAWTRIYRVEDLTEVLMMKAGNWYSKVMAVIFSPDGSRLLTGNDFGVARVWDTDTGNLLLEYRHNDGRNDGVLCAAFSPDGLLMATGGEDGKARIWESSSGKYLLEVAHERAICSLAFSPDSFLIATGSRDKKARIWDVSNGSLLCEVQHDDAVTSVAFSTDGLWLATGSEDNTARIWEANGGSMLLEIRHGKQVRMIAFSPDNRWLATGSQDNSARIWNTRDGSKVRQFEQDMPVNSVAFSPDGGWLATGGGKDFSSKDNFLYIWPIAGNP